MISLTGIFENFWKHQLDEVRDTLHLELDNQEDEQDRLILELLLIRVERLQGNFKTSLKRLNRYNPRDFQRDTIRALYMIELSTTFVREGSEDEALRVLKNFSELRLNAQQFLDQLLMVEYLDVMVKIWINKHNLTKAEKYLERARELVSVIHHPKIEASTYNNAGIIAFYRGDLTAANHMYKQSLELDKELGDTRTIGVCHSNIGYNYYLMGDQAKSLEYLHEAVGIFEKLDNHYYMATAYFNIIRTYLFLDNLEKARFYFDKMDEIWNEPMNQGNERIASTYKLCKALLLMRGNRLRDKIKAQEVFVEVIEEELETQFVVIAMIHVAEILLMELRISEDEEIINEIFDISKKLEQLAKDNDSKILRVHSIMVNAKIQSIQGKYVEAFESYKLAEDLTMSFDIKLLYQRIIDDLNRMRENVSEMREILDKNASITQRIEHSEIESYLNSLKNVI